MRGVVSDAKHAGETLCREAHYPVKILAETEPILSEQSYKEGWYSWTIPCKRENVHTMLTS